jgi:hypothetical protein
MLQNVEEESSGLNLRGTPLNQEPAARKSLGNIRTSRSS